MKEKNKSLDNLKRIIKIILITEEQVNNFGNMLEVRGKDDKRYLVSSAAHQSLKPKQIEQLETRYNS
jgi:hypothetical protein